MTLSFRSLPRAHDHRWELEHRQISKDRKILELPSLDLVWPQTPPVDKLHVAILWNSVTLCSKMWWSQLSHLCQYSDEVAVKVHGFIQSQQYCLVRPGGENKNYKHSNQIFHLLSMTFLRLRSIRCFRMNNYSFIFSRSPFLNVLYYYTLQI